KESVLPIVNIHGRSRLGHRTYVTWRQAQQEVGERGQPCSRIRHCSARISAIQGKAVLSRVIDHVSAHPECMLPVNPGQRVTVGNEMLIQRAKRVSSAIGERSERVAKAYCWMSKRGKRKGACYSAVSVYIALVKSNTGEESLQRSVAVLQQVLAI